MREKLYKKRDITFFVLLCLGAVFIFWKCRYGFGNEDESFYLTIPYRLYQGDGLFVDEWHLSQMASFITYPVMCIYMLFHESLTGIVLTYRYLYATVQVIVAIFIYIRFRKLSWIGALCAALAFMIYAPFAVMALSYNTMGIIAMVVSFVIILTTQSYKRIQFFIAGVFFAAAFLCCPYILIVFIVYFVGVLGYRLLYKKQQQEFKWSIKGWCWFTIGALLIALLFLIFVLQRADWAEILNVIPMILNDPEHELVSLWDNVKAYFKVILLSSNISVYIYAFLILLVVIIGFDKKRLERRELYFSVAVLAVVLMMLSLIMSNCFINFFMWPMNITGFFAVLLTRNKTIRDVFSFVWIPGILYSFCIHMSSNQYFHAISSASTVALVGSVLIVGLFVRELIADKNWSVLKKSSKICLILVSGLLVFQISTQVVMRYQSVYWEISMKDQTCLLTTGPEAGIYATEEKKELYNILWQDTQQIRDNEEVEKVLYLSKNSWLYLGDKDTQMATYSGWLSGINETTVERMTQYYQINPDKTPDAVFVEKEYSSYAYQILDLFEYQKIETENGNLIFYITHKR